MTIRNSALVHQVTKVKDINLGHLYFLNDIVVSEFKEGVHVTYENAQELITIIREYFGSAKPFGFISNMIHSYSMNPADTPRFKEELKNLSAYGVVSYNAAGKLNAEIENNFCKNENICFDDLYKATNTISKRIKQVKIPIDEFQE